MLGSHLAELVGEVPVPRRPVGVGWPTSTWVRCSIKKKPDTGRTGLLSSDGITLRAGGGAVMPCRPTSRHPSDSSKKKKPGGVTRRELPVPLRKIIGDLSTRIRCWSTLRLSSVTAITNAVSAELIAEQGRKGAKNSWYRVRRQRNSQPKSIRQPKNGSFK